ncbi:MAG: carbamoyltransferase HypF [Polyangiales bacterium]
MIEGRRIEVRGAVQGVGFRPWVYRLARRAGLRGRVRNHARGVTIEAFGMPRSLAAFVHDLEEDTLPSATIVELQCSSIPAEALGDFIIDASHEAGDRSLSIAPDLATCSACCAEVSDPEDRRFGYAFTNCTGCGPRFTITTGVPYDRASTTMSGFDLCPACTREFHDPNDRRFHAQPNACPACGPSLSLWHTDGSPVDCEDPIVEVAARLRQGAIVAVKGLGGFHLACDARDRRAVRTLRHRKNRDEKPFAVMVRDVTEAYALGSMTAEEESRLCSAERPIVLTPKRVDAPLAEEVAPDSELVGLLLPYTPLHHLLLERVRRPLVMTSGNVAGEPICKDEAAVIAALGHVADAFLVHDRPIATRCDDSVVRVIARRSVVLRRGRGFVPRPVRLTRPVERPVLACGAQLKNTFCIAIENEAYLGPHVGDLETLVAIEFFEEAVQRMQSMLGVEAEVIAHDLHPGYASTRYATSRERGVTVGVQHHHAHVVSAMAEHGVEGPVLGIAYDGTGFGTDGTAWGGELLLCFRNRFERLATFRPFRLPGGDVAMREVWRASLGLLYDAFDGAPPLEELPLFHGVSARPLRVATQMVDRHVNAPSVRGVGRYFDAVGALALQRPRASFEAQIAVAWNTIADRSEVRRYPFDLDLEQHPHEIDLRPMVRAIVGDLLTGVPPASISAKFHNTLVTATVTTAQELVGTIGRPPVVLTGGAFQNPWLSEGIAGRLRHDWVCLTHEEVPPGDGGIALGQAVAADAMLREESRPCA